MMKMRIGYFLLGLISVCFMIIPFLNISGPQEFDNNPRFVAFFVLVLMATLSGLTMWIWMIVDYFDNRKKIKYGSAWGWGLFFGIWVMAIIYFLVIYRTREKKNKEEDGLSTMT